MSKSMGEGLETSRKLWVGQQSYHIIVWGTARERACWLLTWRSHSPDPLAAVNEGVRLTGRLKARDTTNHLRAAWLKSNLEYVTYSIFPFCPYALLFFFVFFQFWVRFTVRTLATKSHLAQMHFQGLNAKVTSMCNVQRYFVPHVFSCQRSSQNFNIIK